jgi:cell division transport system ATP-binding protein
MSRNPLAAAATDIDDVVRFEHVSVRYGSGEDVLKDISFSLTPGDFHFVTGPSGAGKSSLLKLIYLAVQPSGGRIRLFGQDVAGLPPPARQPLRRRIGVVFQDLLLLEHLCAFDNAALPLRIGGGRASDYRADVAELLTWVGLGARMQAMPATLAGGEKQRLAIARAVVNRPQILLADEPTSQVDHEMALRIYRLFVELNRLGTTILIATHDQDLVARSGRPSLHLEGGRLSLRGPQGPATA